MPAARFHSTQAMARIFLGCTTLSLPSLGACRAHDEKSTFHVDEAAAHALDIDFSLNKDMLSDAFEREANGGDNDNDACMQSAPCRPQSQSSYSPVTMTACSHFSCTRVCSATGPFSCLAECNATSNNAMR
jgi:hypothetical protein